MESEDIFSTCALTITASEVDTLFRVTCRCVSGQEVDLEFEALATLADLRAELDIIYEGVPEIVLLSTGGVVYPQALDLEPIALLPHINEDGECSMHSEESDCHMT